MRRSIAPPLTSFSTLTRMPHGAYSQFHTSADNLDFVRPETLAESLDMYLRVLDVLENDRTYVNLQPRGEPQLGKRGLYPSIGAQGVSAELMGRLWVLNLSDGRNTLLDVAERANLPFGLVKNAAGALIDGGLLQ